ncbi:MAG: SHOCT domain-containing protein [Acidimicrobiales bacterium]
MDGGIGWGGWVAMVVMMVVFWGAIAWVVVTLIRHSGQRAEASRPAGSNPLEILDERFARGEIDDEEYQRRRAVLRESR